MNLQQPSAAASSEFIQGCKGTIKIFAEQITANLDASGKLKPGALKPPAIAVLWQYVNDWSASFAKINNLDMWINGHQAAVKEASAKGVTPCSLCNVKAITKCDESPETLLKLGRTG